MNSYIKLSLAISAIVSFALSQPTGQGLDINDLEVGANEKLVYPYSGKVYEFWKNGNPKLKGRLRDGLRNGKWTFWHQNSQKMAEGKYFDGDGSDVREDTGISMKGCTGTWVFYYPSGQQWREGTWQDGVPKGEHMIWYPNGNNKTVESFQDGQLAGPVTKWYEDGQVKEEAIFVGGKLDSSFASWYSNGSKKEEGDYIIGVQSGHWTYWHENGELKRDGSFNDGEMDGIWVEYSADGNSIQRSRYSSGLFLYDLHWGPKELYDRAGKLRKKDVESALIVLDNIVNSFKDSKYSTRSQFLKAEIFMNDLKDYNGAIREYKTVVKLFPTTGQAQDSQYMVSYIYGNVLNNKKQAKKEYKVFLKKYPGSRLVSAVKLELKQLNSRLAKK